MSQTAAEDSGLADDMKQRVPIVVIFCCNFEKHRLKQPDVRASGPN